MPHFSASIRLFPLVLIIFLFTAPFGFSQGKADLEVKVQPSAERVRGGETFSYIVTVRNIGTAKATDVLLRHDGTEQVVSGVSTAGTCGVTKEARQSPRLFLCELGDVKQGETVSVNFALKIGDFGGYEETDSPGTVPTTPYSDNMRGDKGNKPSKSTLADVDAYGLEDEENNENNRAQVSAELLPSKNLAPRVKILSPKDAAVIVRSAKKTTAVTFTIQAFDPDGTIEKVDVNTQQFSISVEYPENKIVIEDKKYSIKEVEDNKPAFQKFFGGEAVKTGKDTYSFTLENPRYGYNQIYVEATDNGGRTGFATVNFVVKGDNSIEFTSPVKDLIVKPNTDVVIETKSKLNDGKLMQLRLIGDAVCCAEVLMKQISQVGNVYLHRYVLENVAKGYVNLQVILTEDSGAFTYSESLYFKVTEKPTIKIAVPKNQIFKAGDEIPLDVEAADADGEIKYLAVSVNGIYGQFNWRVGGFAKKGYLNGLVKGTYRIQAKVTDDMDVQIESEPITIVVN